MSNAFSWIEILEFRLKFHWSLFLRVQRVQHSSIGSDNGLAPIPKLKWCNRYDSGVSKCDLCTSMSCCITRPAYTEDNASWYPYLLWKTWLYFYIIDLITYISTAMLTPCSITFSAVLCWFEYVKCCWDLGLNSLLRASIKMMLIYTVHIQSLFYFSIWVCGEIWYE